MASPPDDSVNNPFESHLGYLLRRASKSLMGELGMELEGAGLKISEASILLLVEANPRVRPSELGRALGIQRANMVPLTAGLERRGLVDRVPVDGRSHGLIVTDQGRGACADARAIMAASEQRILERLTAGDPAVFRTMLARLWSD